MNSQNVIVICLEISKFRSADNTSAFEDTVRGVDYNANNDLGRFDICVV